VATPHRRSLKDRIAPAAHVVARTGCLSIGTVYVLIGAWALLALLRVADPAADEQRILHRLLQVPLGGVFVAAIAVGTTGYILWLIFEAVFDPYKFGNTLKGALERIGIALSSFAYGAIVAAAVRVLLRDGASNERRQQHLVATVLHWPGGRGLIAAAGLGIALVGLYQLKYVYDGDHERRLDMEHHSRPARLVVNVLGWAGYGGRCAILMVFAEFLLRAATSFNPRAVGDTDAAFNTLSLSGGPFGIALFTAVALGTIAYGAVMYINAVYFDFGEA
jgi:Domain of Unknown Function (DUF1206)